MTIDDLTKTKLRVDDPSKIDKTFEDAWKLVEHYCSDAVSHYKSTGKVLYRGIKQGYSRPDIFLGKPRPNRKIVGGNKFGRPEAELCDIYLKTAGFNALRLSSIFCNSSKNLANGWGYNIYYFSI